MCLLATDMGNVGDKGDMGNMGDRGIDQSLMLVIEPHTDSETITAGKRLKVIIKLLLLGLNQDFSLWIWLN